MAALTQNLYDDVCSSRRPPSATTSHARNIPGAGAIDFRHLDVMGYLFGSLSCGNQLKFQSFYLRLEAGKIGTGLFKRHVASQSVSRTPVTEGTRRCKVT